MVIGEDGERKRRKVRDSATAEDAQGFKRAGEERDNIGCRRRRRSISTTKESAN